jgi:hypothetical protein
MYLLGLSLAAAMPAEWRVSARRGWAGEMDGLFRHSPSNDPITVDVAIVRRNRAVNVG